MFKRLHIKLTAYMGLVLLLFMCFIATGIYNFTRVVFENSNKELMNAEAIRINALLENKFNTTALTDKNIKINVIPNLAFLVSERLEACYIVYNDNYERIYVKGGDSQVADSIKKLAVDSFEQKENIYSVKKINDSNYRVLTRYFNDPINPIVVQVYQNTINEEIIWSFLKSVLLVFGLTGAISLIGISYIFTGQALKPVKETWIRQKEFVADASHELRTPLTVIQTNLDVILSDEDGSIDENEIWLDNAYSETRVMAKLIDQLLILAKADANEEKLDISLICLSEIVENVFGSMEPIAKNKNLEFVLNMEDNVEIKGDYDKIRRLVVILIDNAIKYTEKGKVTVSLYIEKNRKIFSVEDTGIGINKKDVKRIFDRFYRADKARHREGGTGLGLSIAKWIADVHRFSLTVESTVNEGSKFTMKM